MLRHCIFLLVFFFFFFSSRRRHTRYWRDWSSDVCSSDLVLYEHSSCSSCSSCLRDSQVSRSTPKPQSLAIVAAGLHGVAPGAVIQIPLHRRLEAVLERVTRSEERRVGKGGRSWLWSEDFT